MPRALSLATQRFTGCPVPAKTCAKPGAFPLSTNSYVCIGPQPILALETPAATPNRSARTSLCPQSTLPYALSPNRWGRSMFANPEALRNASTPVPPFGASANFLFWETKATGSITTEIGPAPATIPPAMEGVNPRPAHIAPSFDPYGNALLNRVSASNGRIRAYGF